MPSPDSSGILLLFFQQKIERIAGNSSLQKSSQLEIAPIK